MRVRVVLHAGEVHYDPDGCYGEALDIACRLLTTVVKKAFKASPGPLILVVSGDIYSSVVRHGYDQTDNGTFHRLVAKQIAGSHYTEWIARAAPTERPRMVGGHVLGGPTLTGGSRDGIGNVKTAGSKRRVAMPLGFRRR